MSKVTPIYGTTVCKLTILCVYSLVNIILSEAFKYDHTDQFVLFYL